MPVTPVSQDVARLTEAVGPERDAVIRGMETQVDQEGFPAVGTEVGGWLHFLTRLVGAKRVFEFGSGFGYSAYWFVRALPEDGMVVLTEIDADELDQARAYFDQGGFSDRAQFEEGDATEIAERYDGPFDIVLIDNEDTRYIEAFKTIRGKLRPGSLVIADNTIVAEPIDTDDVLAVVEGEEAPDATEASVPTATPMTPIPKPKTKIPLRTMFKPAPPARTTIGVAVSPTPAYVLLPVRLMNSKRRAGATMLRYVEPCDTTASSEPKTPISSVEKNVYPRTNGRERTVPTQRLWRTTTEAPLLSLPP